MPPRSRRSPPLKVARRHDQRVDRRRPLEVAGLDRGAFRLEVLGGAGGGEDLAIGEGLVAGDVIEVPVAERDGDRLDPALLERSPDEAPALDRDVGVVDERLAPGEDGVAGDPE